MSALTEPGPADELGPIDFHAIEFPASHITAAGFGQLLFLADHGVNANTGKVDIEDLCHPDGVDLSIWMGASSGTDGYSAWSAPGGGTARVRLAS